MATADEYKVENNTAEKTLSVCSYLEKSNRAREANIAQYEIEPGDFIKVKGWSYWCEVKHVWDTSVSVAKLGYTFKYQICALHKKDDPWDWEETIGLNKFQMLEEGSETPRYNGRLCLTPWMWNYCGRNTTKDVDPVPFIDFLELHGFEENIFSPDNWREVKDLLKSKRIKRWFPIAEAQPLEHYNKTIWFTKEGDMEFWKD